MHSTSVGPAAAGVAAAGAPVGAVAVSGVLSTVVVVDLLVVVRVDEVVSVLVGSPVAGSPPHPATSTSVDNSAPTTLHFEECERCRRVGALNCRPFVSARVGVVSHRSCTEQTANKRVSRFNVNAAPLRMLRRVAPDCEPEHRACPQRPSITPRRNRTDAPPGRGSPRSARRGWAGGRAGWRRRRGRPARSRRSSPRRSRGASASAPGRRARSGRGSRGRSGTRARAPPVHPPVGGRRPSPSSHRPHGSASTTSATAHRHCSRRWTSPPGRSPPPSSPGTATRSSWRS